MRVALREAPLKDVPTVSEYERIFERYLDICNQAIEKNKDQFLYMEIWKMRWKELDPNHLLQCAVYDDRPKVLYARRLSEDMKIKIVSKTYIAPHDVWPFKYTYLKQVVENPQHYIENPADLDWGWLSDVFE